MKGIVIDNFPTKELMERAKKEYFMVLAFVTQPPSVRTPATAEAFQAGWLLGLGLEPDSRLALIVIPRNLDFESAKAAYLAKLEEMRNQPLSFVLGDFLTIKGPGDEQ